MDNLLNINMFDGIIIGLIILLSIKGLISGFIKELFNTVALIGAIFMATLYKSALAQYAKESLNLDLSTPLLELIATLLIFISIFFIVKFIYKLLNNMLLDDELSATSRLAGMLIKIITLFFVFSLITYGLSSKPQVTDKFKDTLNSSKLYPVLKQTGATILNDPATKSYSTKEQSTNVDKNHTQDSSIKIDETNDTAKSEATKHESESLESNDSNKSIDENSSNN